MLQWIDPVRRSRPSLIVLIVLLLSSLAPVASASPGTPGQPPMPPGGYRLTGVNDVIVQIDTPSAGATVQGSVLIGGWAIDRSATSGTGVDMVHIYRDAPAGQPGSAPVGAAAYGGARPDVGAVYGSQFTNSGWNFLWDTTGVPSGSHTLYVYAHSTADNAWKLATRTVTVQNAIVQIDAPSEGATVQGSVLIGGWAIDRSATSGTGVDMVHIYRDAPAGQPGSAPVGAAAYGGARPDVGAVYGSQFTNSGWTYLWSLAGVSGGQHVLYVYAHSTVTNSWSLATRRINVNPLAYQNDPLVTVDRPRENDYVSRTVTISGWAIDRNASSGTGVDAVHVYRDGPAGAGGVGIGVATYGSARPDVGAAYGSQFTNSGWSLSWNTSGLTAGAHTLYVYAHSTVTGAWMLKTVPITVITSPTRIANISLGAGTNPIGITTLPALNRVYVTNSGADSVSVINSADNSVVTTVAVGDEPYGVSANPSTNLVYVTNAGTVPNGDTLMAIDATTNTVVTSGGGFNNPFGVAVNPNNGKVYVANHGSNSVTIIQGPSATSLTVGDKPFGVTVNPSTNKAYVSVEGTNSVVVINPDDTIGSTIALPAGAAPHGITNNATTNKIYVANYGANSVSVINGSTDTLENTISVGTNPFGVGVNPLTNRVYVANEGDDTVTVIDGATFTQVGSPVSVGDQPHGVGVYASIYRLFVTNAGSNSVSVIQD